MLKVKGRGPGPRIRVCAASRRDELERRRHRPHSFAMSEYDADILEWSEHQAALLRRAAAGERVNDLDWPNIIDEVESVGREQLHTVEGKLAQALAHMLKAAAWPHVGYVDGWTIEARRLRDEAADRFVPSMRQKIDVAKLYRRALRYLPPAIDGQPPLPVPQSCTLTLDELLAAED